MQSRTQSALALLQFTPVDYGLPVFGTRLKALDADLAPGAR
jgi:hypothetical protein